jgi:hypothetical protein
VRSVVRFARTPREARERLTDRPDVLLEMRWNLDSRDGFSSSTLWRSLHPASVATARAAARPVWTLRYQLPSANLGTYLVNDPPVRVQATVSSRPKLVLRASDAVMRKAVLVQVLSREEQPVSLWTQEPPRLSILHVAPRCGPGRARPRLPLEPSPRSQRSSRTSSRRAASTGFGRSRFSSAPFVLRSPLQFRPGRCTQFPSRIW